MELIIMKPYQFITKTELNKKKSKMIMNKITSTITVEEQQQKHQKWHKIILYCKLMTQKPKNKKQA